MVTFDSMRSKNVLSSPFSRYAGNNSKYVIERILLAAKRRRSAQGDDSGT